VTNSSFAFSSCQSDFDCQAVLPGSVCVSLNGATCSSLPGGNVCAMVCP
jgi:hypothetical protein